MKQEWLLKYQLSLKQRHCSSCKVQAAGPLQLQLSAVEAQHRWNDGCQRVMLKVHLWWLLAAGPDKPAFVTAEAAHENEPRLAGA